MQPWENTVEFWKKVRKGTLLPEASTATNDTYKIKFEHVPYTGLWWDTTVQNAEHCDGIINNFLLQSDLDDDICRFEFFSKLLRPYLRHKQSRERVHGGPLAPGVHKNAWKVPVLERIKPFEFSSLPHIDAQHQPQQARAAAPRPTQAHHHHRRPRAPRTRLWHPRPSAT